MNSPKKDRLDVLGPVVDIEVPGEKVSAETMVWKDLMEKLGKQGTGGCWILEPGERETMPQSLPGSIPGE